MTHDHGGHYPPPGGPPWGGPPGPPPGYPNHPGHPQPQPPAGKNRWPWILGISAAAVVLVLVAAVGLVVVNSGGADEDALARTEVTYEVTGAAESVELSYQSAEGQQAPTTVRLPWTKTVTLDGEDAYFHVEAQTTDGSDQELACRVITHGTTLVEDRTVSGLVGCLGRVNE